MYILKYRTPRIFIRIGLIIYHRAFENEWWHQSYKLFVGKVYINSTVNSLGIANLGYRQLFFKCQIIILQ